MFIGADAKLKNKAAQKRYLSELGVGFVFFCLLVCFVFSKRPYRKFRAMNSVNGILCFKF